MKRLYFLFALCGFALTPAASAQNMIGTVTIDIDQDTGYVSATCETDADDSATSYLSSIVLCKVTDQNGSIVASGSASDPENTDEYAFVELDFYGVPGNTYTVTGTHEGKFIVVADAPQGFGQQFVDFYNFYEGGQTTVGFFGEMPDSSGRYSYSEDLYGPGPEQILTSQLSKRRPLRRRKPMNKSQLSCPSIPRLTKHLVEVPEHCAMGIR
jgi:hypothetical protein